MPEPRGRQGMGRQQHTHLMKRATAAALYSDHLLLFSHDCVFDFQPIVVLFLPCAVYACLTVNSQADKMERSFETATPWGSPCGMPNTPPVRNLKPVMPLPCPLALLVCPCTQALACLAALSLQGALCKVSRCLRAYKASKTRSCSQIASSSKQVRTRRKGV